MEVSDKELIESFELGKAVSVLHSLNHEVRQQIMQLLHVHKKMTVRSIYSKLGLEQSFVSHHLANLRKFRLVKTTKFKNYVIYSIDYDRLKEIHLCAHSILQYEPSYD